MPPSPLIQQELSPWLAALGNGVVLALLIREVGRGVIDCKWLRFAKTITRAPAGTRIEFRSGPRSLIVDVGLEDRPPDHDTTIVSLDQARRTRAGRSRRGSSVPDDGRIERGAR